VNAKALLATLAAVAVWILVGLRFASLTREEPPPPPPPPPQSDRAERAPFVPPRPLPYDDPFARAVQPSLADQALARLAADPDLEAYHRLAQAERALQLGYSDNALNPARQALSLLPDDSPLRVRASFVLAGALRKSEDPSDWIEAAGLFGQFVTSGAFDDAARSRILLLHRAGFEHWAEALEACADAQRFQQYETPTRVEADIYLRTENFARAIPCLEWLLDRASSDPQLLVALGRSHFRLGRDEQARETLRMAEGHIENEAYALATVAEAYAHIGKHEDALRLSIRARELSPDDHDIVGLFLSLSFGVRSEALSDPVIREQYHEASRNAFETYPERFPDGKLLTPLRHDGDTASAPRRAAR
jgi:tetratricopeptide (TPR) repeat protein